MSVSYLITGKDCCMVHDAGITYNLGRMLNAAGFNGWDWPKGRPFDEVVKHFTEVRNELSMHPEIYQHFNPPNGWGTYTDAIDWLTTILKYCEIHPEGKIEINR